MQRSAPNFGDLERRAVGLVLLSGRDWVYLHRPSWGANEVVSTMDHTNDRLFSLVVNYAHSGVRSSEFKLFLLLFSAV